MRIIDLEVHFDSSQLGVQVLLGAVEVFHPTDVVSSRVVAINFLGFLKALFFYYVVQPGDCNLLTELVENCRSEDRVKNGLDLHRLGLYMLAVVCFGQMAQAIFVKVGDDGALAEHVLDIHYSSRNFLWLPSLLDILFLDYGLRRHNAIILAHQQPLQA